MMKSNLNCDHQLVFYETSLTLEFFALGSTGDEAHLHTEAENAIFNGNDSFFFLAQLGRFRIVFFGISIELDSEFKVDGRTSSFA